MAIEGGMENIPNLDLVAILYVSARIVDLN
jgi:hypothetical protein